MNAHKKEVTLQERLLDAIKFSRYHWDFEGRRGRSKRVLKFFKGIPVQRFYDDSSDATGSRKHHLKDAPGGILATEDIITLPVSSFLQNLPDSNRRTLYEMCRNLFVQAFVTPTGNPPEQADCCSSKILERAYLWSLAIRGFHGTKFSSVKAGRILEVDKAKRIHIHSGRATSNAFRYGVKIIREAADELESSTLYYADEGKGEKNHPGAGMWFLTCKGKLVLLEVSGLVQNTQLLTAKVKVLQSANNSGESYVLAPNVSFLFPNGATGEAKVHVETAEPARQLLGGLVQLLDWMPLV